MKRKVPIKYKIVSSLILLSLAVVAFLLVRILFFYEGAYKGYISSTLSFSASALLYAFKISLSKALEPYKIVSKDKERLDRPKLSRFRSSKGLTRRCFGLEIPEIEEIRLVKRAEDIKCEFLDRTFIPRDLIEMVEPHREKLKEIAREEGIATRGHMKARVISRNEERIKLERVPYLYSFIFHFSPGLKAGKKSLLEILHPLVYEGEMISLEKSRFPNHLGVRCIAITKDGFLIISIRGLDLAVGKAYYSLSCEGSVSVPRNRKEATLKDLIHQQVSQELGLDIDEYEAIVMSYSRDLAMLGKPNVYVLLKINLTKEELEKRINTEEDLKFIFVSLDEAKRLIGQATHTLIFGLCLYEEIFS